MNNDESMNEKREQEASSWMWRFDRGLRAEEQDAFFDWLAESPENSDAFAKHRRNWKRLDNLGDWLPEHSDKPNPDLLAPSEKSNVVKYVAFALGLAALIVLSAGLWQLSLQSKAPVEVAAGEAHYNRTTLEDGSVIKLKDDAEVTVLYSPEERRVRLDKGEAFFIVTEDPNRPFIVEVHGVDVSALGTAFNVRLDSDSFEVLVSEGVVQVDPVNHYDSTVELNQYVAPRLEASQRAIISLVKEEETPEIATLTQGEIHRVLAWQHGLMSFTDKPLSEIAYELNHFNETQMLVLDDELAQQKFSGTFRSDNMEGFVRLLELGFGAKAEWNGDSEIFLSKNVD